MNEKELPIGFRPKFDPEFKPEPVIISPPPRCGKTQLLKAIESLKPRCEKFVMKKRHSSGRNYKRHSSGRNYKRIYNWYYHCSLSGRKHFSNAKCYYWV